MANSPCNGLFGDERDLIRKAASALSEKPRSELADKLDACKLIVKDMGTFREFTGNVAVPSDLAGQIAAALRSAPPTETGRIAERLQTAEALLVEWLKCSEAHPPRLLGKRTREFIGV